METTHEKNSTDYLHAPFDIDQCIFGVLSNNNCSIILSIIYIMCIVQLSVPNLSLNVLNEYPDKYEFFVRTTF